MCTHGSTPEDARAHDKAHIEAHEAAHKAAHNRWTRRQFMRVASAGAVSLGLGGIRVGLSSGAASDWGLARLLAATDPDRVLILIQLSGGNDGLNTVVPLNNDLYHLARPRLGIRANTAMALTADTGLHPNLSAWEAPFKDGKLAIVQNVGYENPELSHFVSSDVWLSADDPQDLSGSGWLGRHLEGAYPDFGSNPPEHPIAVQIGSASPLLFQGASRSMGVSFPTPSLLTRLASGGTLYDESDVPAGLLGEELSFVRRVSNNSFGYAAAIKTAYDAGENTTAYPRNSLGGSLATVARLIRGGLGSQIYHVTLGGFDTHANQAGTHATLMRRLGDSTAALLTDLANTGLDERVLAMTFSEFGRRIKENGSAGTDHGTAAPLFVFGGGVQGGIIGNAPDLSGLDRNGNLVSTTDFRSVYASVLSGWFDSADGDVARVLGSSYSTVPLFASSVSKEENSETRGPLPTTVHIDDLYPNPARSAVTLKLSLPAPGAVRIALFDLLGREVAVLSDGGHRTDGGHVMDLRLPAGLAAGRYHIRVDASGRSATRALVIID